MLSNEGSIDVKLEVAAVCDDEQRILCIAWSDGAAFQVGDEVLVICAGAGIMAAEEKLSRAGDLEIIKLGAIDTENHARVIP